MALLEMEKIRLYAHKSVANDVLRAVQRMGVAEFVEVKPDELFKGAEKTTFEFNYVSSRLDFAVEFLSGFEEIKKGSDKIRRLMEGKRVFATEKDIENTAKSFYFNDIIDRVQHIQEKINDADIKRKNLQKEEDVLERWIELDMPLSSLFVTKRTKTIFLNAKKDEFEVFSEKLKDAYISFDIKYFGEENAALVFLKEDEATISDNMKDHEIEMVELPKRRGTPKEELVRIVRAKNKAQKAKEMEEGEARKLTEHLPKLKMVADHIFWKKQKHDLISRSPQRYGVVVFEAWVPNKKFKDLEKTISDTTNLFDIEKLELSEEDVAPVEIENNALVRPFEAITRLYGLPGSKDLDPTPFLAGFFFIFFGLCLTDVGYGLFLFSLTAAILFFFRVPQGVKPLLSLLMLGGLSSFLIGLLFGGYLGIDMSLLPAFLRDIQIFDPIASPLPIFYMALAFGVFQIMFGLVLGIIKTAKAESLKEGILNDGPWLALFVSLILWGGSLLGFIPVASGTLVWLVYASLASLILTQGRKEKTLIKKFLMGLLSLYNSINFFSDVLSYSRLLALGLATSALAFAVNLIASMVNEMVPFIGGVLMVIVLVVGHLFNLAVNLLGAFIHSARLQFVEFFGKFISGTGRNFIPFKRKERYVVIRQSGK